tara:strand:- start:738 stop:1964 length:1227 start_codon:yes stop_codon:yes gene_type:complete
MAKKKKEEPVVDNEVGKLKVKEKPEAQPTENETKGDVTKVKAKMKQKAKDLETVTKVNLDKPKEEEKTESKEDVITVDTKEDVKPLEEVVEKPTEETKEIVEISVDEVTTEEKIQEVAQEVDSAITKSIETGKDLPDNIQKLVDFMDETGGDIEDYVKLNQDYSEMDNDTLLRNFYQQTRPHLDQEEIEFLMEDQFSFDTEMDDNKDIKRKKLALKEQVAQAKQHLESVKSKYYEDIKSGGKLTQEQQNAIDFFNKYNMESEESQKIIEEQSNTFVNKTNQLFNDKFKGFEYNIGDKKFRINVNNVNKVKDTQSDINNFIKKFLNKDNLMEDASGYHKSLYTAMNADIVANHFYEQGKADALKESIAKSKNVNMDPRQSHAENVNTSGIKVRALNDDGPDFKFKIKNK